MRKQSADIRNFDQLPDSAIANLAQISALLGVHEDTVRRDPELMKAWVRVSARRGGLHVGMTREIIRKRMGKAAA